MAITLCEIVDEQTRTWLAELCLVRQILSVYILRQLEGGCVGRGIIRADFPDQKGQSSDRLDCPIAAFIGDSVEGGVCRPSPHKCGVQTRSDNYCSNSHRPRCSLGNRD